MSPSDGGAAVDPAGVLDRAPAPTSTSMSRRETDAGVGVGSAQDFDTVSSSGDARDGGMARQLDSAIEEAATESVPTSLEDAGAPDSPTTNDFPASDGGLDACLGGSDVADVGCDVILQGCPLDTDLVVLCFTIWNKSRSEVMQATLACFDGYGCKPGAADALSSCFEESSKLACIEDRSDCSALAGGCAGLTKAYCEASLAPFHDAIRDKTMTCVSEAAAADATRFETSCVQVFEECLGEVSSPVML